MMQERLARLESRLSSLADTVRGLEARLGALEGDGKTAPRVSTPPALTPPVESGPLPGDEAVVPGGRAILPLIGRTLLVLGGAFLIRALTDEGILPPAAGVAVGLAYSVVFGILADRCRGAEGRWSAAFYGLSSTMIALPLLFEAATRFKVLSPLLAAALLTLLTAFLVGVAWRRDVQLVAWLAVLGSLATVFALLLATHAVATLSATLIVLGAGTLWLTYGRRWHGLRWPFALAADLLVSLMAHVAAHPGGLPEGYEDLSVRGCLAIALALPVVYLGSIALRTLSRKRSVNVFEVVQAVLALLAGFGGAVRIAWAAGNGSVALGVSALVVAAGCYVVAFSFVERRPEFRNNFLFYSSLAVVLTLAVSPLVFGANLLVPFWCALALTAAFLGARFDRISLGAHAAAYVCSAAALGGLFVAASRAFFGSARFPFSSPGRDGLVVLATAVASYAAVSWAVAPGDSRRRVDRVPAAVLGLVAVFGLGGGAIDLLALLFGGPVVAGPARLAAIRTVVLAVAAFGLALARRHRLFADLAWLAYPVLVAGGIKLLLEDLRVGGPASLVVAFGFYGAALILVPRVFRGGDASEKQAS